MKLTLEALEVLDAIDKKGSFAGAAAALHRVPSTITYTVQKLEEDLEFVIFRREGRRSVLTPAGKVLMEQGRELLRTAEQILESAQQVSSGWESSINIAIDTVWNISTFYPIVAEFHQLGTGVEINLSEEVLGGSLEALLEGRADLVIGGHAPVMPMKGFKFEQIMNATWEFVVSKNHPLTQKALPLDEEDIKHYPSIIIKDSSRNSAIRGHRVFDKQLKLRVPSMHYKIVAIRQGLGIGFLPTHKIQQHLESGELVALSINTEAPDTPQHCAWKINNKGKAMRWFVERILKEARSS